MATLKKEFTQADLDGTNKLVYYHGTNTNEYAPLLYDNNNVQRTTIDIFSILDSNTIILELGNAITGTWTLYLQALTDVGGGTVRELHDLDIENAPTTDYRLALGKAGVATKNILLNKFYELLDAVLNFCKRDGSNITNAGDFRTALDVITEAEVISNINTLALVPAVRGVATLTNVGQVFSPYIITFADIGTANYHVVATITSPDTLPSFDGKALVWNLLDYKTNSFAIKCKSSDGASASNYIIDYMIFLKP